MFHSGSNSRGLADGGSGPGRAGCWACGNTGGKGYPLEGGNIAR